MSKKLLDSGYQESGMICVNVTATCSLLVFGLHVLYNQTTKIYQYVHIRFLLVSFPDPQYGC